MTTKKLQLHLKTVLPAKLVPSAATLNQVLKSTFHLKYGALQKANLKYRDPTYNDKRLWISKLLAQFLKDEAIVVSVDESNFRSDSLPSKQWQFNSNIGCKEAKRCTPLKAKDFEVAETLTSTPEQLVAYGNFLNKYGHCQDDQAQLRAMEDGLKDADEMPKAKFIHSSQM